MEIAELPKETHPFMLGTQFHPEFLSRPLSPHPLVFCVSQSRKRKGIIPHEVCQPMLRSCMGQVLEEGFTFDDVLIIPSRSAIEPAEAKVETAPVRGIFLSTPLISSAMDTVTDARFAIALGKLGGLGIIHRNQTLQQQLEHGTKGEERRCLSRRCMRTI